MAQQVSAPFSRRVLPSSPWIDSDFPASARIALEYLLDDLVEREYVRDWVDIGKELTRLARLPSRQWNRRDTGVQLAARKVAIETLEQLEWYRVLDFIERLHQHLPRDVYAWSPEAEESYVNVPRSEVQGFVEHELERILIEENLAFRFKDGRVERRAGGNLSAQIQRVESTFGDSRLDQARAHFRKALVYFRDPREPDLANAAKEAVCALEAAARSLFPDIRASTLGKLVPQITGTRPGQLPRGIAETVSGLYTYRNATPGVSHGSPDIGRISPATAEYILVVVAAQIALLHQVASEAAEAAPF